MHLTRLRLNGFKSFVDATEMPIEPGITGVVGPNGCGKSNLLEALRWVMGENRPTAMRGAGMEDVIFAGSASRPARNFAEVALSIDNSDRRAPAGFNDSDEIEITRRITRDLGSTYRLSGKEVRARDVQMLFADASTGAHSPALVRQGQIAELINARPRARRRVLEEAAGISGLYQRRHEAELRLNATEANLARVEDVLNRMDSQLAQLGRQVRQAIRYREIGTALRQIEGRLLWRRWQAAAAAMAEADIALAEALRAAGLAERQSAEARRARESAEAGLPPLRDEDAIAGSVLQRLRVERDTIASDEARARGAIEAIGRRLRQIEADAGREAALGQDAANSIARLEAEEAALAREDDGHDERLAQARAEADAAAATLAAHEATLDRLSGEAARLAAHHHEAERAVSEARQAVAQAQAEAERVARDAATAVATHAEASTALAEAQAARAGTETRAAAAEAALTEAEAARAQVQRAEAQARSARAEAEAAEKALRAEASALERLMARDGEAQGAVAALLQVAPGFENALAATLADDLNAPLVDTDATATGWADLPANAGSSRAPSPPALPSGVRSLADHVQAPAALRRRLGQIGIVDPEDGVRLQPALAQGQRLVSMSGDLWRWDGFRRAAADRPSAAAMRLERRNRLAALASDLSTAQAQKASACAAHDQAAALLAEASEAEAAARQARSAADRALAEAGRALSLAEAARDRAAARRDAAAAEAERLTNVQAHARDRLDKARELLAGLDDPAAARAEAEAARAMVEAARAAMMSARAVHDGLRRAGEDRAQRRRAAARDLADWRARQASAGDRISEIEGRAATARAELVSAQAQPALLADRRARLDTELARATARQTAAAEALAAGEAALRAAMDAERAALARLGEARAACARSETRLDAARAGQEAATARIAELADTTPQGLHQSLGPDDDAAAAQDSDALEAEATRLRRAREALGAVNLRAEADMRNLTEERDRLADERADLEAAVARLRAGIATLNREGRERLLTAFEQVNTNFATLFNHLFGGGEARLVLVESDDPLEAGLEIMCQPPGKKLSTLSLLSGGEQTLTALALIFGVFLANPAPICVLDEVDAPLDDANVARFCDLLDEMTRRTETRFLIITHNAITMSRMDRLFGVTMAELGISQLVSVDLRRAESLVA